MLGAEESAAAKSFRNLAGVNVIPTEACGVADLVGHATLLVSEVALETLTFEERNGKTLARTNSVFQSVEARDGMVQAGMEYGVKEGYERLDELLAGTAYQEVVLR